MPRPPTGNNLSIPQLQQILQERKAVLRRLEEMRSEQLKQLDKIDLIIGTIGGAPRKPRTSRPRNERSLTEVLEDVLRSAGKPMRVADITNAVLKTGYRSTSDNFRAVVNQMLIKERRRFISPGERGVYQIRPPDPWPRPERPKPPPPPKS